MNIYGFKNKNGVRFDTAKNELLGMIFPTITFAALWLGLNINKRNFVKKLSPKELQIIDDEIPSSSMYGGIIVTSAGVIGNKFLLRIVPTKDLLWVYPRITTVMLYSVLPIYKYTTLILADKNKREHRFNIRNNGKAYSFAMSELMKLRLDIIFGDEPGRYEIYRKDINRMIELAQESAKEREIKG